jgi:hypothetical protein
MFEHDGLFNWRGRGALPCTLRAWQRWSHPVALAWICLARVLNTGTFGRLTSPSSDGARPQLYCTTLYPNESR